MNLREVDWDKYRALKARMKAGEFIPQEDFAFVKLVDQTRRVVGRKHPTFWGLASINQTLGQSYGSSNGSNRRYKS